MRGSLTTVSPRRAAGRAAHPLRPPALRRRGALPGAVLAVALVAGCAGGGSPDSSSSGSSARASASTSSAAPSASSSPSASGAALSGYGATKAAWLAAHDQAPGYAKGAAFGPIVTNAEGHYPMYAAVQLETPVVVYTLNLPGHTSLAEAKRVVLQEFPPGARYDVFDSDQAACLIASIRSPQVQRALQQGGWAGTVPVAAFGTATATTHLLDPSNVTSVTLVPTAPGKNLGDC